ADGSSTGSLTAQEKYTDFAARMGWDYVLVDAGWSASWVPTLVKYAQGTVEVVGRGRAEDRPHPVRAAGADEVVRPGAGDQRAGPAHGGLPRFDDPARYRTHLAAGADDGRRPRRRGDPQQAGPQPVPRHALHRPAVHPQPRRVDALHAGHLRRQADQHRRRGTGAVG